MKNKLFLLFLLICASSLYYYQYGISNPLEIINDGLSGNNISHTGASRNVSSLTTNNLGLDKDAIKIIERLVSDVDVKPEENNLDYIIKLDHEVGRPLWQQRKYRETHETYKKVLKVSYNLGSLRGIQIALGVLGNLRKDLGQHKDGMDVLMLAYKVALMENDPYEYGLHEKVIAENVEKEDRGMALMWRLKAREHLQGTPHVEDYVSLLGDIADDLKFFKRQDEALNLYREAYELSEKVGGNANLRWVIKNAQYKYSNSLVNNDECNKALPLIKEHLSIYNNVKDKSEWYYENMLYLYGKCQSETGQKAVALNSYMQAFSSYETRRSLANSDEDRASIDKTKTKLVNQLVQEYINIGQFEQGLLMLETNKARTLADILADPAQKEVYKEWEELQVQHLQELEKLFEEEVDPLQQTSFQDNMNKYFDLQKQQREDKFNLKLSQESKQILTSERMTPDSLMKILQNTPDDTAVLSVFVNNETLGLFVMVNREVKYYSSEYKPYDLKLRIKEIKYMIGDPEVDFYRIPSEEIYTKVFAKALQDLGPQYKRLIISLDGYFQNLPLGILSDSKRFLAERYIIQQYPSLRYFKPEKQAHWEIPDKGITCVDPAIKGQRLPFQQETSIAIKAIAGTKVTELIGKECTNKNIKLQLANLDKTGFMHIGAHGVFTSYDPMRSGIMLGADTGKQEDDFWNAIEMGTTDMRGVSLLTLSSCNTGIIDEERARDVFGILRGVFYAGVDNVVAPLWPLDDLPTSILMQSFYKHYLKYGDPARALREAQLMMIKDDKYNHPYYWGAFISMGGAS